MAVDRRQRTYSLTLIRNVMHLVGHVCSRSGFVSYGNYIKMIVLCDQLFPFHDMNPIPNQEHLYHHVGRQLSICHSDVNTEIKFIAGYSTVRYVISQSETMHVISFKVKRQHKMCDGMIFVLAYSWRSLKHLWKLLLFLKSSFMGLLEAVMLCLRLSLQEENWVTWWPVYFVFSHWSATGHVEGFSDVATGWFPG